MSQRADNQRSQYYSEIQERAWREYFTRLIGKSFWAKTKRKLVYAMGGRRLLLSLFIFGKNAKSQKASGFARNGGHETISTPTASYFKYFDIFFINNFTLFLQSVNFSSSSRFFHITMNQRAQKLHYTKSSPSRTPSSLLIRHTMHKSHC